jgi:hypothetical protein
MLENTEGAIKKAQYRETGNLRYHHAQANTNNVNKNMPTPTNWR